MLLFLIKALHSVAIIYFMGCLWILWNYALSGIYARWMKWIIASLLAESIIFISYGLQCPLTIWAIDLGDETGADLLSDMLYLDGVDFVTNYVIFCGIGLALASRRYIYDRKRTSPLR